MFIRPHALVHLFLFFDNTVKSPGFARLVTTCLVTIFLFSELLIVVKEARTRSSLGQEAQKKLVVYGWMEIVHIKIN